MRILVVTGTYAGAGTNPWLLDDLCAEFAHQGHEVDVIVFDPTHARDRGQIDGQPTGVKAWSVGSTRDRFGPVGKLLGYLQAGIGLHTLGMTIARETSYDLCIYTSIAAFSWGFPARIRRLGIAKRLVLVLWDFFPIHQLEIGRIRARWLAAPLKALERLAIRRADVVALMTPANERFYRTYHRGLSAETILIPPWSSSGASALVAQQKMKRFTAVFGGQLVKGRGIETLLAAAAILQADNAAVDVLVAGDGSESGRLREEAKRLGLTNLTFVGAMPREEYRSLLARAHIGIAITVPGVTPPSFPSKIVEYCGLGLPVVVCVEPSSDAGDILELNGAGIKVTAGDAAGVANAIGRLLRIHELGGLGAWAMAAHTYYATELSTPRAVHRLSAIGVQ